MLSIEREKRLLRDWAKSIRMEFSTEMKTDSDRRIQEHLLQSAAYREASVLFLYVALPEEVETKEIIKTALRDGKQVGVPKVTGPGRMEVHRIEHFGQLKPGKFGVLEPEEELPLLRVPSIDVSVVPCLAADRKGGRLGMGGGYYDRFLVESRSSKIVLCPEVLLAEHVPMLEHDVYMDAVVTEEGIYGRE